MSLAIPGAYPFEPASAASAAAPSSDDADRQFQHEFAFKQCLTRKTRAQHDLFTHVDAVVYLLVGFQFIRYCHMACLVPAAAHLLVQRILGRDLLDSGVLNRLDHSIRRQFEATISVNFYVWIWWKTLLAVVYHVGFVWWYSVPMVNAGLWDKLGNGDWWFVLFIGEEIAPIDIDSDMLTKLTKVGLWHLIVVDVVIGFCQLVLHQAVFRQSTINERRLDSEEVYLVRSVGDSLGRPDVSVDPEWETPLVLTVKMYEEYDVWHRLHPTTTN